LNESAVISHYHRSFRFGFSNAAERQNKIAEWSQVEQSTIWFAAIRMCCNAVVDSQTLSDHGYD
jgi:hypothetical protein